MFEKLGVPEECKIDNTIYKKMFIENGDMNAADKKILSNIIDKIIWKYSLKKDNCFIRPFNDDVREYVEVEILEVKVKERKKEERIAEMIMRAIPYPMILVLTFDKQYKICVSHQRKNQSDVSKNVIENVLETEWVSEKDAIDIISFNEHDKSTFYAFYCSIVDSVSVFNAKKSGAVSIDEQVSGEEARIAKEKQDILLNEIDQLRRLIKKETQFNRKMEINIKIKRLERKLNGN